MTYFLPATDAVASAARGLALAHPGLIEVHRDPLYLRARSSNPGRTVALVSGGGSGHEPLHTGLLGPGGLDAVCPGEIFASPHNRQIYEASAAAAKSNGVLLIIKNYTGDVINFSIAAERLRHALPAKPHQVLAIVNGLGATTSLELHAIGSLLYEALTARGIQPLAIVP